MAEIKKRNARKPLAAGALHPVSWSNFETGERFHVTVGQLDANLSLVLTREEATALRDQLDRALVNPEFQSRRSPD